MTETTAIVWFRDDLRVADNPALVAAAAHGAVLPVFVLEPSGADDAWGLGGASRWWLHHSLCALRQRLQELGLPLVLLRAEPLSALQSVIAASRAKAVFWNRRYTPAGVATDRRIKKALRDDGLHVRSFRSALLHEPWEIETATGGPYRVFTPYWRRFRARELPSAPLGVPRGVRSPEAVPLSDDLDAWGLLPRLPWAARFPERWQPGEHGAQAQLKRFEADAIATYSADRERPAVAGTSRLSPHLRFGEISPARICAHLGLGGEPAAEANPEREHFLRELAWREFAWHLLYHHPDTTDRPLRSEFGAFPWSVVPDLLTAWRRGETGFPLVDAGMRELWATGWMHNRVRMLVASVLVKHFLQPWQEGARWFWDTLVDADLANNTLGWQWSAGCGADAAPYFRVFNPTLQARRFDPEGTYIATWVPELAGLPTPPRFAPFDAPPNVLAAAGVVLGTHYPHPVVSHADGRARALAAWESFREGTG